MKTALEHKRECLAVVLAAYQRWLVAATRAHWWWCTWRSAG